MAYTKIHAIKATVDKAIDYICNAEKTDEKMFVSSYACSPEIAAYDFKYTLDHCRENSPNKAYHLIQAFAPGEVGFEEAHRIGKELADKLLEGKYSYIVTTHIDKGHVHNHIIFCVADNIELDFMKWVVESDEGRDMLANEMGFVTPFTTFSDYLPDNPLVKANAEYTKAGKTPVSWNFTTMPSENWKNNVGGALLNYAQGTGTWDSVQTAFVDGWAEEYAAANE